MRLHKYVIDSAQRRPDSLAVASGGSQLSYGQLDGRANGLATRLIAAGLRPGDRVVLYSDKSPDTVVAMQAVLRTGAAYVPVDSSTPVLRAATIVADCAPRVVLCDAEPASELAEAARMVGATVVPLVSDSDARPCEPVDALSDPHDLAYILYTSGSTGTPKGVCVSHRNAMSFVDWAVQELGATPEDRFSNHAPFGFDLSVLDLYGAFAAGASVHLIPKALAYAPTELVRFLNESQISVWYSVPSALILMMTEGSLLQQPAPAQLRAVLFAGEPFPITFVRELASWSSARLLNLYGPTETNVCTFHEVRPADLLRDRPVPIGRSCSGDTVELLDDNGKPAQPGGEGEVVVSGPTVMLGYWGQPPAPRDYRTGDRAVLCADGALDYVGRRDHMVKVRGHRIELGDIESALDAHPGVERSAVVVAGEGLAATLVAFVVPVTDANPGLVSIKAHLASLLPTSMNVDVVHRVQALPRSDNGKIERRALLDMHLQRHQNRRDAAARQRLLSHPEPALAEVTGKERS
ncbi:MAG TPA: amino acid adenylation domain-containing protein [Jatrophihabitans sp.]|uniref:amino acid adenylation domain-containing protein n=1 Tax=Jatrophihabitans sp. TaxID=1932789 RepID=UPI002F09DB2F